MHWHPYRNTPTEQHKYLWINEHRQRVKKKKIPLPERQTLGKEKRGKHGVKKGAK
jgi:hypothetical protein